MTDVSKDSGVGVSASELGECGSLGGNDEPHLLTSAESAPDNGASILHTNDAETGNASYVRGYKTGRDAAIADVVAWLEKRGRYYQHRGDTCLDFRRIAFEDHGDVLVEIADAIERGEHNNNAVMSASPKDTHSDGELEPFEIIDVYRALLDINRADLANVVEELSEECYHNEARLQRIMAIIDRYINDYPDDSQILSYLHNEIVSGEKYGAHDD